MEVKCNTLSCHCSRIDALERQVKELRRLLFDEWVKLGNTPELGLQARVRTLEQMVEVLGEN